MVKVSLLKKLNDEICSKFLTKTCASCHFYTLEQEKSFGLFIKTFWTLKHPDDDDLQLFIDSQIVLSVSLFFQVT